MVLAPASAVMKRDLAMTLRMLEADGVAVRVSRSHGRLQVSVGSPVAGQPPVQASFGSRDGEVAADWLVARVFDLYPQSQLSRLWRTIAAAAVAAQDEWATWRGGGRAL